MSSVPLFNDPKATAKVQSCLKDVYKCVQVRLPDGYSHIFRLHVFDPSGFWTMAPQRYAAKFDPILSLHCARVEGVGAQSNPIGKIRKFFSS